MICGHSPAKDGGSCAGIKWLPLIRRGAYAGSIAAFTAGVLLALQAPIMVSAADEPPPTDPTSTTEPVADPTSTTAPEDPTSTTAPTDPTTTAPVADPPVEPPVAPAPPLATTSLLIKMVAGLSDVDQQAVVARDGGVESSVIVPLRLHVVDVDINLLAETQQRYASDPQVQRVSVEKTREAQGVPSDTDYGQQWALPQIGWDQAYGTVVPSGSAIIAVLDTGVDGDQPDLAGHLVPGFSAFPDSSPTVDPNGHGTAMATIAAAATDNATGTAGVAYAGVQVMPVQVLDANGLGQDGDIIAGVVAAADAGANVILMSFSSPSYSPDLQDAINYAWTKGAVLVAATGNDGSATNSYPAGDAKVVGVSATDSADALWSGSNYGADTFLGAPGVDILAGAVGGGTTSITGTSASAAIVAGAAAMLRANDPTASNGVIVGRLARNADAAGTADQTGNGRVNLNRALADTSTTAVVPAGSARPERAARSSARMWRHRT